MRVVRRVSRILAWIFVSLLGLVLLVYLLIQVPAVQNYVRGEVEVYLENKLKTEVRIGKLNITFPKRIILEDVYFEDQRGDTLLAGEKLNVNIAFFELLNNKVSISDIQLDGIRANIYRNGTDSAFNYEYIFNAFTTASTSTSTSAPMQLNLDKVVLNKVVASFRDDHIGSDMYINIGNFSADVDEINPDSFLYTIPLINLKNTAIRMKQYKPIATPRPMAVVEAQNTPPKFDINLDKLNLKNVTFNYDNAVSAITTDVQLGDLIADARSIDLDSMYINLEDFQLNNTTAKIVFGRSQQAEIAAREIGKDIEAQANNPWRIRSDKISLKNNFVQYDDNNQPRQVGVMDYAHMSYQDLNLEATAVIFSPVAIEASIESGSFREQKSGIVLRQLEGDLVYGETKTSVENLFIQTDKTNLRRRVLLTYESIESMALRPGDIYLDADIDQSTVAVRDIIAFAPALRNVIPFKGNENEIFNIDAVVRGYIKDLSIPTLNVSSFRNSTFSVSGSIKGLPSTNPYFDLVVNRFSTTKTDLAAFLPKGSIPDNIRLPETMSGRAAFKGSPTNYNTRLVAQTNKGNVDLTATMNGQRYKAKATTQGLDIGYILMQPNIGKVSMQANISGNGFDFKSAPIDIDAYVSSAHINGYTYNNIKFTGNLRNGILNGKGDIKDSNADLDFAVVSDLKLTNPSLDLQLQVDSLNLNALGFSNVPFKIHGNINVNMPSLNMATLNGNATITNVVFVKEGKRFTIDTISLIATPNSIALRSEVAIVDLKGNYNLTEIGYAVQNIIHQYYTIPGYQSKTLTAQQDWTLTATVFPSDVLYAFMPEIKGTDTVSLTANLNTTRNDLRLLAGTRKFYFNGQYADSLTINANTTANQLLYSVNAFSVGTKDFRAYRTSVTGDLMNDLLNVRLDVKDRLDKSRYRLAGVAASIPGGFRFSLNQDSVMFDYDRWSVGAGNFIQSTTAGLLVNNFTISKGDQVLSANSRTSVPNSPIDLAFKNFQISTITGIINQDQLLMGGTINGTALVSNFDTSPVFTSDLQMQDFSYKGDTLGNITAKINNQTANTLAADIRLLGDSNDVHLNGSYVISSQTLDMKLNMNKFDLSSIKPFLTEQLRDIGGTISGNMDVAGKLTAPDLNGTLRFNNAFIAPAILGERFSLPNQELRVTPQGIRLDNFVIKDSLGGEAIIDGSIATSDFTDFEYDFYLTANDFRVMNTKRTANSEYYGKLNIDVDLAVYGNMKTPTLEGNLRVNEGTDLFVVLPGSNPEIVSREGVVQFVDMDNPTDSVFVETRNVLDSIINSMDVAGLDVAATIETDTAAQLNLIVNDLTGDILSMRGRADLAAGIDRSGKISLTGNYELNSGYYELSFEFIRRRFDIQKGSTVTWTGDPTQAVVDVTATYVANTAPINLVAPQLGESTAALNRFKQRLPFNVMLYLNGQILEPVISFDIQMPQGYAAAWKEVDEKLIQVRRDQAELNKQVFALLLLGRFVQENPFQDAGAGVSVARLARESVSRVITEQLNQWANELLPGFGLSFGVISQEDYSTGELRNRTDLNVSLTRQMFNDRIRVTIGSNFELEGPANSNSPTSPSTGFASDVAIDYLLSKDGKYMLRAYRRNIYEVMVEGQVVESGLRFIMTMDYNHFRELFRRRKTDDPLPTRRRTTTNTTEEVPKPVEDPQSK